MWYPFAYICFMFNFYLNIYNKTGTRILDTFNEWYLSSNVIKENM